jgi:hypothetical protein
MRPLSRTQQRVALWGPLKKHTATVPVKKPYDRNVPFQSLDATEKVKLPIVFSEVSQKYFNGIVEKQNDVAR